MAKISLKIYDLSVSEYTVTDKDGNTETKDKKDVELSLGDSEKTDTITKKMTVEVLNRETKKYESEKQEVTMTISIGEFGYHQQFYQPDEITAQIKISVMTSNTNELKQALKKDEVLDIFSQRKVSLNLTNYEGQSDETNYTVGKDYYIHEVSVRKNSDMTYVLLKIYSPDKMMTTAKYCRTWTAKRLESDILTDKTDGQLQNYKFPYDSSKQLQCDFTNVKHVQKVTTTTSEDSDGNKTTTKTYTEHRFPYLVQYNESFYEFLARTANRWGEFMYYYDGKLRFGYDDDENNATEIDNYNEVIYRDLASTPKQENRGNLVPEAQYEDDVLNSKVTKDSYAMVMGTINTGFSGSNKSMYWLMKIGSLLSINDSGINWLFDTVIQDLLMWWMMKSKASDQNDDFNEKYFNKKSASGESMKDDQYSSDGSMWNQQSEINPILDPTEYAKALVGEMIAGSNTIEIDYDTYAPSLHIGQLIKLDDSYYIVSEITSKQKSEDSYTYNESTKTVEKTTTTSQVFTVKAIAKVSFSETDSDSGKTMSLDAFYPTIIPGGHIRQTGPQMAVVVDAEDPRKKNRVRIMYPWQLTKEIMSLPDQDSTPPLSARYEDLNEKALKDTDISNASPWILFTTPNGPDSAGVHSRHYTAEKVLVNYLNNNIERPYVVGAASTSIAPGLTASKGGSFIVSSPNGQSIKVHEGDQKGATAMLTNLFGLSSLVSSFYDFGDMFSSDISKAFEGGIDMGDKYGVWGISGSTHNRSVTIKSSWGTVSVSAYTGITISAPNGDINISGKNVNISAGNNLTLSSGANMKNQFWNYINGRKFSENILKDLVNAIVKKICMLGMMVCDFSILRSLFETFWKPMEGKIAIESGRYLMLGAGGAKAGYPDAAYKDKETAKKYADAKKKVPEEIHNAQMKCAEMVKILDALKGIAEHLENKHVDAYKSIDAAKENIEKNIVCILPFCGTDKKKDDIFKKYNEVKFWDADATIEAKDFFKDGAVEFDDSSTVTKALAQALITAKKFSIGTTVESAKEKVLVKRRMYRDLIVENLTTIHNTLSGIHKYPFEDDKFDIKTIFPAYADMEKDTQEIIKKIFKADKVKESDFYKVLYGDITGSRAELAKMENNLSSFGLNTHPKAFVRLVALQLFDEFKLEQVAIRKEIVDEVQGNVSVKVIKDIDEDKKAKIPEKPSSVEDLENDVKWELFTMSLNFTEDTEGMMMGDSPVATAMMTFMMLKDNVMKTFANWKENLSWSEPQNGQILFGVGRTLQLNKNGTISNLKSTYNSVNLSNQILIEKDKEDNKNADDDTSYQEQFRRLFVGVRDAFKNVGLTYDHRIDISITKVDKEKNVQVADNAILNGEKVTTMSLMGNAGGVC